MEFFQKIKPKIIDKLSSLKSKLARSETYTIFLPTILACLFLLAFAPLLLNNSALQFQIEQKVSAALKANLEIAGKVEVALLPSPSFTVNNVSLQNYNLDNTTYNFYAKSVTIKLSFLSSLIGRFSMDKIIFSGATLESYDSGNKPAELSAELSEAFSKNSGASKNQQVGGAISGKIFVDIFKIDDFNLSNFSITNLPKIMLENSHLISYNKVLKKREIKTINGVVAFSKKHITASGSFSNQDIINNFKLQANFEQKSVDDSNSGSSILEINSAYGNFKISGHFPSENLGLLKSNFKGTIEAEIFDLKSFYKSYVAREGVVYDKINPSIKPIKLKTTLINNSGEILLNNIFISSNAVNGRGNIALDLTATLPLIDIKFNLENIDLDAIWLSDKEVAEIIANKEQAPDEQKDENENSDNQTSDNASKKDDDEITINSTKDLRDFDLTAELTVNRVKYLQDEIKNVNLYTTISKQGEILILPLTLEVPGGGLFRMSGVLDNNGTPKFVGKFDASGKKLADILKWLHIESQNLIYDNLNDYTIYSDIMLIPNSTIFNDLYLNINSGQSEVLGELRFNYSTKTSNIISNFRINNFNFDDYFLTSGQNIYLSPGSLLKKLLWLNNLTSNNDLTLSFDKLAYKGLVFNDQSVKIRFGQGYFELSQLKLKSDQFDLTGALSIDLSEKEAKFDMSLASENFVYAAPQNSSDDNDKKPKEIKINALDQFFALPSLEGFNGVISLKFTKADFDGFTAENILINGKLKDGVINFSNFTTDIYNGNLIFEGAIGMKFDKALSGNLTLSNIALKPFLFELFSIKNIDGIANFSSSVVSAANKKDEFMKNLSSETKFIAGSVIVENYGLNDLVRKMFNIKNYGEELRNPEQILFSQTSQTSIKKASGSLAIDRGHDDLFRIDIEGTAFNGIVSGKIDLVRNSVDGLANIIFLTGDARKQTPLNIATNLKGDFGSVRQSTNLDQVLQYLSGGASAVAKAAKAATGDKKTASPATENAVAASAENSDANATKANEASLSTNREDAPIAGNTTYGVQQIISAAPAPAPALAPSANQENIAKPTF